MMFTMENKNTPKYPHTEADEAAAQASEAAFARTEIPTGSSELGASAMQGVTFAENAPQVSAKSDRAQVPVSNGPEQEKGL